jgi:hypothetical protein
MLCVHRAHSFCKLPQNISLEVTQPLVSTGESWHPLDHNLLGTRQGNLNLAVFQPPHDGVTRISFYLIMPSGEDLFPDRSELRFRQAPAMEIDRLICRGHLVGKE